MATKVTTVVTGGTNSASTTAADINNLATDFFSSGIVGAVALNTGSGGTGGYAVNAQGSPNMTVRVSLGDLYMLGTPSGGTSQRVRVDMSSFEDVTIAANASGSTRYDWVYMQLSATALANPGANKDDVATLVVSRSTSNATDNGTPPTYGYNLAIVTVANGAASITNANITDKRVQAGATSSAMTPDSFGQVAAQNLSTSAITLGYTGVSALNATTASASPVQQTSFNTSVTIPAGGRKVKITVYIPMMYGFASGNTAHLTLWYGTFGSGQALGYAQVLPAGVNNGTAITLVAIHTPSAGAATYSVGLDAGAGTVGIQGNAYTGNQAYLLVEAI